MPSKVHTFPEQPNVCVGAVKVVVDCWAIVEASIGCTRLSEAITRIATLISGCFKS